MSEYQCLCAEGMPDRCPCKTAKLAAIGDKEDAALASREELEALLTPEGLAKFDEAECEMTDRIVGLVLCNCWYRPDGTRIGYTIADGCQAHPDDQVTDEDVWKL